MDEIFLQGLDEDRDLPPLLSIFAAVSGTIKKDRGVYTRGSANQGRERIFIPVCLKSSHNVIQAVLIADGTV